MSASRSGFFSGASRPTHSTRIGSAHGFAQRVLVGGDVLLANEREVRGEHRRSARSPVPGGEHITHGHRRRPASQCAIRAIERVGDRDRPTPAT